MNLPKLLFVYDHKYPDKWMDGLWAALNLLEKDFEITRHNLSNWDVEDESWFQPFDFALGWGGFQSKVDTFLRIRYSKEAKLSPKHIGLCIGGNGFPFESGYDMYFYETEWVKDYLKLPKNSIHAFGINSDLYNQDELGGILTADQVKSLQFATPVIWDCIGVGSFSYWKRWELMKNKLGNRLVIGEYQKENEQESSRIVTDLLRNNIMVSNMVSPYDLANIYRWSRSLYIPAEINGGGERAVLEGRACGLKVEIEDDNPKLKELLSSEIWDEKYYASQLKKGIMQCLTAR